MARLNIDTGTEGNVATGDTLRTAMTKINNNFIDVYGLVGDPSTGLLTNSTTNGDIKVQPNGTGIVEIDQLQINNSAITPLITNGDLTLGVNGTGQVVVSDDRIVITTTKTASGVGSAGDVAGSIAWDTTNLYVCTANYDGSTAVWKKLVLQAI
ncbi:MAG: hypothetical protein H8D84_01920 [Proteobacteria bacterium]|nr:hypothetical protein [Pseudomonadota bacterium]